MKKRHSACLMCKGETEVRVSDHVSSRFDRETGKPIVVPGIHQFVCLDPECGFSWIPTKDEERISEYVLDRSRFRLSPEEIAVIRSSLPSRTKTGAANLLCLNYKAFTKWENGYSAPNDAYDLLLRLAVFDKKNLDFISHLQRNNFKFEPTDYQLVCEKLQLGWSFVSEHVGREGIADYKAIHPVKVRLLESTASSSSADNSGAYLSFPGAKDFSPQEMAEAS